MSIISLDDVDVSSDYRGLAITFADGYYMTTNASKVFHPSGVWAWDDTGTNLALDNELKVNVNQFELNNFEYSI